MLLYICFGYLVWHCAHRFIAYFKKRNKNILLIIEEWKPEPNGPVHTWPCHYVSCFCPRRSLLFLCQHQYCHVNAPAREQVHLPTAANIQNTELQALGQQEIELQTKPYIIFALISLHIMPKEDIFRLRHWSRLQHQFPR